MALGVGAGPAHAAGIDREFSALLRSLLESGILAGGLTALFSISLARARSHYARNGQIFKNSRRKLSPRD